MSARSGVGYDSQRFEAGRRLVLGGVEGPSARGLAGHSDADALTHAITDALLGAAGLGDIGQQFPDTDERWRDADSVALPAHVSTLGRPLAHGAPLVGPVERVDAPVMMERPKLSPHRDAIRASLETALGCPVNVKATTGE